jgi:hypothetical protein
VSPYWAKDAERMIENSAVKIVFITCFYSKGMFANLHMYKGRFSPHVESIIRRLIEVND